MTALTPEMVERSIVHLTPEDKFANLVRETERKMIDPSVSIPSGFWDGTIGSFTSVEFKVRQQGKLLQFAQNYGQHQLQRYAPEDASVTLQIYEKMFDGMNLVGASFTAATGETYVIIDTVGGTDASRIHVAARVLDVDSYWQDRRQALEAERQLWRSAFREQGRRDRGQDARSRVVARRIQRRRTP
jgi:hypothetical protein